MYRRHRSRRLLAAFALTGAAMGGILAFKLWPGAGSLAPAEATPDSPASTAGKPIGPEPAMMTAVLDTSSKSQTATKPPPPEAPGAPPKISMGQPVASAPPANSPPAVDTASAPPKEQPKTQAAPPPTPPPPVLPADTINRPSARAETSEAPAKAAITSSNAATQRMNAGLDLLARNKAVEARKILSEALRTTGSNGLTVADADRVRLTLTELNKKLVFGQDVAPNDPFARVYAIESGDALAKLPRKLSLNVDWRFLQRINNLADPTRLQVGQKIKVVTGPFHAVVHKPEFRMDLYMGNGDERVFVRSFTVGLGEFDATPEGVFAIRSNSKLINPEWSNPRTGEHFYADDPNNPIGERWIGLVGVSENIRDLSGYGIHGTIDPDSIGTMKSMGCVRMHSDDVNVVYELLMENVSRVEVHGEDYP
jgi:hypothetical protein